MIDYEQREKAIISALRMAITEEIRRFKELNFNDLDDKYFLSMTRVALDECVVACGFILDKAELILGLHKKIGMGSLND